MRHTEDRLNLAKAANNSEMEAAAQKRMQALTHKYQELNKASGLPSRFERTSAVWGTKITGSGTKAQISGAIPQSKIYETYKIASESRSIEFIEGTKHTREELEALRDYAAERNINFRNFTKFDGDIDLMKEQFDVISDLCKEYDISKKITVLTEIQDAADLASTNGYTITFNSLAMRNKDITTKFLTADNILSSTGTDGIATHEMWHIIKHDKNFYKGLDLYKSAWYNVYGKALKTEKEIVTNIIENISRYVATVNKRKFRELISEVMAMNKTSPNELTIEFERFLKKAIK